MEPHRPGVPGIDPGAGGPRPEGQHGEAQQGETDGDKKCTTSCSCVTSPRAQAAILLDPEMTPGYFFGSFSPKQTVTPSRDPWRSN